MISLSKDSLNSLGGFYIIKDSSENKLIAFLLGQKSQSDEVRTTCIKNFVKDSFRIHFLDARLMEQNNNDNLL